MGAWGIQPSEFWDMTPEEWYWLFDIKRTDKPSPSKITMNEDELAELYDYTWGSNG